MNSASRGSEGSASAPVLQLALELSDTTWTLVFSEGVSRRQAGVRAGELCPSLPRPSRMR
jgi:hypothetical protein